MNSDLNGNLFLNNQDFSKTIEINFKINKGNQIKLNKENILIIIKYNKKYF